MNIKGSMASWIEIKSVGSGPSARSRLSASVAMESGDIIIHGGYDGSNSLKDTWKATIDIDKNKIHWERLEDSP